MHKESGPESQQPSTVDTTDKKELHVDEIVKHRSLIFSFLSKKLSGFATREDVEDITQHVIEKALKAKFDFKQTAAVSTWLLRIALNEMMSFFRKQKYRKTEHLDEEGTVVKGEQVAKHEEKPDPIMREYMSLAWERLPAEQQKYLQWSVEERTTAWMVEQEGGINENTVKSRMRRAKEQYKALLTELGLIE